MVKDGPFCEIENMFLPLLNKETFKGLLEISCWSGYCSNESILQVIKKNTVVVDTNYLYNKYFIAHIKPITQLFKLYYNVTTPSNVYL